MDQHEGTFPEIAPWASPVARARMAEVAAGLGGLWDRPSAAEVLATVRHLLREHTRQFDEEGIVLYAGTNVMSPAARQVAETTLGGRPSMGWPGEKYQAGLDWLDPLEVLVPALISRLVGARFAEVRSHSATMANLAVYTALTEPGDTIAVLPERAGGHTSHHTVGVPGVRGLRVVDLPYDTDAYDVDLAALPGFLERERPRLVVIGASLLLFPHRIAQIKEAVAQAGAVLMYDASHVAGLVAAGRFQRPLAEGADLLTFSTYKSFGGPPGGVIATDDEELAEKVSTAVFPALTANYDAGRLAPLAVTAAEIGEDGGAYADRCIAAARALAAALSEEGFTVAGADRGFTDSHHVAVDVAELGGGRAVMARLAEAGIYLSAIGLPWQRPGEADRGLRIGTQEVVRRGLGEEELRQVAALMADLLLRGADPATVRKAVVRIRKETGSA
ncbi:MULTISPECIES: serine hydroxymethyltransferase [Thermomonospora]|uniref:Glycine hydroxymethyltransferase n=1 Tax=Thermomonospora curvata (strain ATCC 19995 / DSM 43183 / JCM 3096 / KCTC 9072 / NBRC 15933 / NCIMB 10081 / Henssen B9) TaxID=471852 RepID=D1AAH6_THECD|nr:MULTISPECIES: beta-eliminating lyase-related protein [Thermomonospora]ACY98889.1 Glycine hydroxymethyltransferase [Thermomonospora curvata DSM 43183]PKK13090.1 MAG: glycine hydroxymethyltransferase [Thermomonospora sp. CIF 1]